MNILITGIPGTGKTTISKYIKSKYKKYDFRIINDKIYSIKNKLGTFDKSEEYVVSIPKLNKSISHFLQKNSSKNIIFEGHLWCELSKNNLEKMDYIFILNSSDTLLRNNMKKRKYSVLKIEENLLCQKINYISNLLNKKNISYYFIKTTKDIRQNFKRINKILNL